MWKWHVHNRLKGLYENYPGGFGMVNMYFLISAHIRDVYFN